MSTTGHRCSSGWRDGLRAHVAVDLAEALDAIATVKHRDRWRARRVFHDSPSPEISDTVEGPREPPEQVRLRNVGAKQWGRRHGAIGA